MHAGHIHGGVAAGRWGCTKSFLNSFSCSVQFFASYTNLLKSSNYVTRRQSLKVRMPITCRDLLLIELHLCAIHL